MENLMTMNTLPRRAVLIGATALLAASPLRSLAQGAEPAIHVLKDPSCGCCSAWIEILETDGFAVTTEPSAGTLLMRYKSDNGVPTKMASCHTARVDGYMVEGHVPPADIRRLIEERPDAIGLAVPGMPFGSPGMGAETERDAYDVFLINRDGSTTVFSHHAAA
ncbi:DUF411 domain-containing protein [Frigidibacter mobilis]|nr:DUF411 domain-containing protein [Frigidibacter mobilis]